MKAHGGGFSSRRVQTCSREYELVGEDTQSNARPPTCDDSVADDAHEARVLAVPQQHRLQRAPRSIELHALVLHDLHVTITYLRCCPIARAQQKPGV